MNDYNEKDTYICYLDFYDELDYFADEIANKLYEDVDNEELKDEILRRTIDYIEFEIRRNFVWWLTNLLENGIESLNIKVIEDDNIIVDKKIDILKNEFFNFEDEGEDMDITDVLVSLFGNFEWDVMDNEGYIDCKETSDEFEININDNSIIFSVIGGR